MIIVDGHCDTIEKAYDEKLQINDAQLMFNLKDVKEKLPYIQLLATYISNDYVQKDVNEGFMRGKAIIQNWKKQYEQLKGTYPIVPITKEQHIHQALGEKVLGILLSTENGAIIGNKLEHIDYLYQQGVRVMGITWNHDNLLGCGALTKKDTGLTTFGKECIKRMNEVGIIVDVSHTSKQTFWDTIALANNVIATHSCVNALCEHPRNLEDSQIKEIANHDGVIGICFYKAFLSSSGKADIQTVIDHMRHLKNLVGPNYIALGSDFDGMEKEDLPMGIQGVKDINNIAITMRNNGFTSSEIEKIMGLNFVRVLKRIGN